MASYLVGVRQFTAFLQPHGRELTEATRACAKRRDHIAAVVDLADPSAGSFWWQAVMDVLRPRHPPPASA